MMFQIHGRSADTLRDSWQGRALAQTRGKLAAVVLVVLFFEYGEAMKVLLRAAFPGFRDISRPFFCGGATIVKTGRIVCNMIGRDGFPVRSMLVFDSEEDMVGQFRALADRLKLTDAERVDMTELLKKWVVADLRINHLGQKVA